MAASYYDVLGVSKRERGGLIRRAFRDLDRRYHPEQGQRPGSRQFRSVCRAYEVLDHPSARQAYNESFEGLQAEEGPPGPVSATAELSILDDFVGVCPSPDEVRSLIARDCAGRPVKSGRSQALELLVAAGAEVLELALRVPVFIPCTDCHGAGTVAGRSCSGCDGKSLCEESELVTTALPEQEPVLVPLDGFGIHAVHLRVRRCR